MIGILFATEDEARPFLQKFERGRFDGLTEGETAHDDTYLVSLTGIGKIKAALRTERLLQRHRPQTILHVGACASLSDAHQPGTIVGASQVFEGDRIELAAPTYPRMPLNVPFKGIPSGVLVTQDHTVQGRSELSYWQRIADLSDMAGYPIAYVAATHGIPCSILKVVTGIMQVEDANYRRTRKDAMQALATYLLHMVPTLVQR